MSSYHGNVHYLFEIERHNCYRPSITVLNVHDVDYSQYTLNHTRGTPGCVHSEPGVRHVHAAEGRTQSGAAVDLNPGIHRDGRT